MQFVHSLVKTKTHDKLGWCAPAELGGSVPHYISFVIPLDERKLPFDRYVCEAIKIDKPESRTVVPCDMAKHGADSFVLRINGTELWFVLRPSRKLERALPYVGSLKHPDFASALAEIEPDEPAKLDLLCEDKHTFLIGCDPFTHYSGLTKAAKALLK